MSEIKIEWCENFVKSVFEKIPFEHGGIECSLFWDFAEKSGLWLRGTYGTPMSEALEHLVVYEPISDTDGNFSYAVFRLAQR